jgi:thiamine-phosphate pyrophosphorylase
VATHAAGLGAITRRRRAELLRGIYVILNEEPRMLELASAVLDAGVRIVQYRAKGGIAGEHLSALRALTRQRDALLILNDDWRAAVQFDCDGVHLGPEDDGFARVAVVAELRSSERLIGLSCGTTDEVRGANAAGVDYLGAGAIYATLSKHDAGAPIGVQGLRALVAESAAPVAAVGGITAARLPEIRASGAAMAAVISAISAAADPRAAARELLSAWNRGTWD